MDKHTPTPWELRHKSSVISIGIYHTDQRCSVRHKQRCYQMISTVPYPGIEEQQANAAFIVKAVNCHDELVEACKSALPLLKHLNKFLKYQSVGHEFYPNRESGDAAIDDLEQAIAKAGA